METAQRTFITLSQMGQKHLHASDIEEYYHAETFDTEEEVETYEELLNTGKTKNPHVRSDWKVTVEPELLPVRKRTLLTELVSE